MCINNVNCNEVVISKITEEELIAKYATDYFGEKVIEYGSGEFDHIFIEDKDYYPIIYPYSKAIAQLIVHEVPKMNVKEISYEELKAIPSKRGTGALGSSGK